MDKKTVSQRVKNLCKPIAIFYGSGVLFALIYYLLCYIESVIGFGDTFWSFMLGLSTVYSVCGYLFP